MVSSITLNDKELFEKKLRKRKYIAAKKGTYYRENPHKFVKEYLNDSKTFRDEIVTSLTGEFDAHYINKEDFSNLYKDIDERLSSIENNNNRNEIE